MSNVIFDEGVYFFQCPHCEGGIIVKKKDVNCGIFRHGTNIKNNKQIDPHIPKEKCEELANNKNIIGCCKPFRLFIDKLLVEKCDYI